MELDKLPKVVRWEECDASDNITVKVETERDIWESQGVNSKLCHELNTPRDRTTVLFGFSKDIKTCKSILPYSDSLLFDDFWPVIVEDLNGSFRSKYITDENDQIVRHVSWSCFKTKHALKVYEDAKGNIQKVERPNAQLIRQNTWIQPEEQGDIEYYWRQMAVLVHWIPQTGQQTVLFLDLPEIYHKKVKIPSHADRCRNPYVWHTALAEQVKEVYNDSVWSMRDLVRNFEKARDRPNPPPPNFRDMHETARHISHTNENLIVAQHTIQSVIEDQTAWRTEYAQDGNKPHWTQNTQKLRFVAKELHSLNTRCLSLDDRLKNEINLLFNLVSQKFGSNASSDNAMMKTIALVSMIYLPGSFISSLFGMNFFNLDGDAQSQSWIVADNFWLYWAITIPVTVGTMMIWAIWHYYGDIILALWRFFKGHLSSRRERDRDALDAV